MNQAQYRAWRFIHPDLEAADEFAGLRTAPTGSVEMVESEASVRQAILLLLTTSPGERVMRPDYGCDLHRLAFSPNDETTAGLALHYVRQALTRWEPRIRLIRLNAEPNPIDGARLDITLEYQVTATQQNQELGFSVNLAGEDS